MGTRLLSRRAKVWVVVAAVSVSVSSGSSLAGAQEPPTRGPVGTPLGLSSFFEIEADPTRDRAFVSGGTGTDQVIVIDGDGTVAGTLEDMPGASGMVLSSDQETLYVGLSQGSAVASIDLDTLEVTHIDVGELCPQRVVLAAGLVWFTDSCETHRGLAALDPATGAVALMDREVISPDLMDSTSARPGMLLTVTSSKLQRWHVTGAPRPTVELVKERDLPNQTSELVVTPNGRSVLLNGFAREQVVVATRDLSQRNSYPTGRIPGAMAVRVDGQVAVSSFPEDEESPSHGEVAVYAAGHTSFAAQYEVPDVSSEYGSVDMTVPTAGLAWGEDQLWAVSTNRQGHPNGVPRVLVLSDRAPTRPASLGSRVLQGTRFRDLVATPDGHRAFMSPGRGGNGVFVLNRTGQLETVLEHLPSPSQMVMSPAGTKLFVALRSGDAIAVIDTHTLRVRRYRTGPGTCPESVALTGNRLWFYHKCSAGDSSTGLGALDLRTGRKQLGVYPLTGTSLYASPIHPRTLWVNEEAVRGDLIDRLAVTTRGPAKVRPKKRLGIGAPNQGFAFTPDGLHLMIAPPTLPSHPVLSPRSMAVRAFPSANYNPAGVEIRRDGLVAAAIAYVDTGGYSRVVPWTIRVRRTALGGQVKDVRFRHADAVVPGGVAFGRRHLYTVREVLGDKLQVEVVRMPRTRPLTLTANKAAYDRGDRVRLVAHLTPGPRHRASVAFFRQEGQRLERVGTDKPDRFGNAATTVRFGKNATYVAKAAGRKRVWRAETVVRDEVPWDLQGRPGRMAARGFSSFRE